MSDLDLIEQSIEDRANEIEVTHSTRWGSIQSGQSASWTTTGQPD